MTERHLSSFPDPNISSYGDLGQPGCLPGDATAFLPHQDVAHRHSWSQQPAGRRRIRHMGSHSDRDLAAACVRPAATTAGTGAKGAKLVPTHTIWHFYAGGTSQALWFISFWRRTQWNTDTWMLPKKCWTLQIVLSNLMFLHLIISIGRIMLLPFWHLKNPSAVWLHYIF